jgi:hypothetical protein
MKTEDHFSVIPLGQTKKQYFIFSFTFTLLVLNNVLSYELITATHISREAD